MSDFPFKVGDLIEIKSSFHTTSKEGVIIDVLKNDGFYHVLVDGKVQLIHRNYIVTPRIKAVRMTGGIK